MPIDYKKLDRIKISNYYTPTLNVYDENEIPTKKSSGPTYKPKSTISNKFQLKYRFKSYTRSLSTNTAVKINRSDQQRTSTDHKLPTHIIEP
jgi:hypothetical protein